MPTVELAAAFRPSSGR